MSQFFFEVALVLGSMLVLLATQSFSALKQRREMREREAWLNDSTSTDSLRLVQD